MNPVSSLVKCCGALLDSVKEWDGYDRAVGIDLLEDIGLLGLQAHALWNSLPSSELLLLDWRVRCISNL